MYIPSPPIAQLTFFVMGSLVLGWRMWLPCLSMLNCEKPVRKHYVRSILLKGNLDGKKETWSGVDWHVRLCICPPLSSFLSCVSVFASPSLFSSLYLAVIFSVLCSSVSVCLSLSCFSEQMLNSNWVPSAMLDSESLKVNKTLWIIVVTIAPGIVVSYLTWIRLCIKNFISIIAFHPHNSSMWWLQHYPFHR